MSNEDNSLPSAANFNHNKGPKNPQHKLYRKNHRLINQALFKRISTRRINITASELYHEVEVTAPTFYLHFHNSDDVLISYENDLEADFLELVRLAQEKSPSLRYLLIIL